MPIKNAAPYLRDCLDSILVQSHVNWELIAVNDHSTDDSEQILKEYASFDSRVIPFRNRGDGIIKALRLALSFSDGDLITRMDADDIMHPRKLEQMCNALVNHGKGHIALGQVKYFAEGGLKDGYRRYEQWLNGLTSRGENFTELYRECVIPSPCFMVYQDDLKRAGSFDTDTYPEDYDLAFRLYSAGFKCIPSNEVIHYWRDYPERTSRTDDNYADNRFLDLKMDYFLKLHHDSDRELVVWGAGNKGKLITKRIQAEGIKPRWVCDNHNKIGHQVYDIEIEHYQQIEKIEAPQVIVSIANPAEQAGVVEILEKRSLKPLEDYFLFC